MTGSSRQRVKHPPNKTEQNEKGVKLKKEEKENTKYLRYLLVTILAFVITAIAVLIMNKGAFSFTKQSTVPKTSKSKASKSTEAPRPKIDELKKLMNKHDRSISNVLRKANKLLSDRKIDEALREFSYLAEKYPKSPLARYGKAQATDQRADKERSNQVVLEAVKVFNEVPGIEKCPEELKKLSLKRSAERLTFLGRYNQAIRTLERLVAYFPKDPEALRALGIQFLMAGRSSESLTFFKQILEIIPTDGHAKSHVGFVLKSDDKLNESISYFEEGIHSGDPGSDDARFYYHLGDAYSRLGKAKEARRVYEEGAKKGLFLSALQRSLYNADTPLKAQPWWTHRETGVAKHLATLESNWKTIRDEAVGLLDVTGHGGFEQEAEKLKNKGDWKQLTLYQRGEQARAGCQRAPKTCAIVSKMSEATGCKQGQIKFSVMLPGTHVWPHTGPTNCRLRAHLGLVIPKNVFIRAGDEMRTWKEGKVLVFDDSFEHEVWHNGTSFRLILIIDFWHPELTAKQRRNLTPI